MLGTMQLIVLRWKMGGNAETTTTPTNPKATKTHK
jgi:hypothetical protein